MLSQCLNSLNDQIQGGKVEVIVVRDWHARPEGREQLKSQFANFVWLDAPADSTVPAMRKLALGAARGELTGFTEDDCVLSHDWCASVIQAHSRGNVAIGGSVEPSNYDRNLDWAVFFCEYARFMPPFQGPVPALPGNNITYKTEPLKRLLEHDNSGGVYEVFVNGELQKSGEELRADPTFSVRNINSWKLTNLMDVPFHHGRGFAAMRLSEKPLLSRLPFLGIAVVLPAVQLMRLGRQVINKGSHAGKFFQCLPQVGLFCISWSVGEFVGYLLGPGTSLKEWR